MELSQKKDVRAIEVSGGGDTLHVALWLRWDDSEWEELLVALDRCQAQAKDEMDERFLELGGVTFEVQSWGGSANFAYWLRSPDFDFKFTRSAEAHGNRVNGWVEIGSAFLMENGFENAWECVIGCLERAKAEIIDDAVSRADLCVDISNVRPEQFHFLIMKEWVSCRAKKAEIYLHNWSCSGISIGAPSSDIRCVIYDKFLELYENKKADRVRKENAIADRFGGELPRRITRCEFRVRKDALREFGIRTVADLLERQASLAKYLTADWLRFIDPQHRRRFNVLKKNEYRTHELWETVQNAFQSVYESPVANCSRVRKKSRACTKQLFDQMFGLAKSIGAAMGLTSVGETTKVVFDELLAMAFKVGEAEFCNQVAVKALKYEQADHDALACKMHSEFFAWAPKDFLEKLRRSSGQTDFAFG